MKILIIEDDAFFRQFYQNKLKEQGFEVELAENGEEGLQKLSQIKPNLVLLDIIMPKKDGFEVLDMMSKDPALKLIPVIVFSTLGQEKDVEKALSLGAKDYVQKTFFDFDNLLRKIFSVALPNPT